MRALIAEHAELSAPIEGLEGPPSEATDFLGGAEGSEAPSGTSRTASQDSADSARSPETLVDDIRSLKQRIAKRERGTVSDMFEIGALLVDLQTALQRRATPQKWGEYLKKLHFHPRVTSRLQKIGTWAREIGLIGSDLLAKLPCEEHKLEWLAKLDREQLEGLFQQINVRTTSRPEVIKVVKQILGDGKPSDEHGGDDRAQKGAERRIRRLIATLSRFDGTAPEGLREPLRDALKNALMSLKAE